MKWQSIKNKLGDIGYFIKYEFIIDTDSHTSVLSHLKKIPRVSTIISIIIAYTILKLALNGIGSVPLWFLIILTTVILILLYKNYKTGEWRGHKRKTKYGMIKPEQAKKEAKT